MLIDEIDIVVRAGHGGAGRVSFGKAYKSGPDGGNGGKGGDVYFAATSDLTALNQFSKSNIVEAENGHPGQNKKRSGRNGKDLTVLLPAGTTLTEKETGETVEIASLDHNSLVCKGGIGGRGNYEFRSARNTTPMYAQPGLPGEEKNFRAVLKFLAEYGLVGLPNAGKSSLLNEITNAKAHVANYPFTTLSPNLGVFNQKVIADIPGLIEGASQGKGLGTKFLKHIEKVKMLLHCISVESEDTKKDYDVINEELKGFDPLLLKKDRVILLTKADLADDKTLKKKMTELKKLKLPVYPISIYSPETIEVLKKVL
jgi:GTPase